MEKIVSDSLFSEWEASPRTSLIIIGSLLDLRFIPKTMASRLLRLLDLLVTYMATLFFSPRLGHIWVMREYGVAESWTKKKCIPMVGVASIFGCIINGKLRIHKCSYRQVKWSFGLCFQNLSFDLVECIVLLDGGVISTSMNLLLSSIFFPNFLAMKVLVLLLIWNFSTALFSM